MLDAYRYRQKLKQYMMQFEIRGLYKRRKLCFRIWRRKLRNRILLKRVFNQSQRLWNYHRNNMPQMRRKQQSKVIRKWRVFAMRKKAMRNYKLQSVMADIHRNIALQTKYYRMWRDLFDMITNHRYKKQRKLLKYETKLPSKSKMKKVKNKKHFIKSDPYYIVPESVMLDVRKIEKKENKENTAKGKDKDTVKMKKKPKRRKKTNRNYHSYPALQQSMFELTSAQSIKSDPVKVQHDNMNMNTSPIQSKSLNLNVKETESIGSMETVNDILISSAFPQKKPTSTSNLSIATSELARDLNRDDIPFEIYHFARKWRYYKPLKQMFFLWRYSTLHPQKMNNCPTQKTIDRLENRSKLNHDKVNKLCNTKSSKSMKKKSKSKIKAKSKVVESKKSNKKLQNNKKSVNESMNKKKKTLSSKKKGGV